MSKYIFILSFFYISFLLLALVDVIPQCQNTQRGIIILIFTSSFYAVLQICVTIWRLPLFLQNIYIYYCSRIGLCVLLFVFHVVFFASLIFMLNFSLAGQNLLFVADFPEQKITFYAYDLVYENNTTIICAKTGFLPVHKKIFNLKNIDQTELIITYNDDKFIITDNTFTYEYKRGKK